MEPISVQIEKILKQHQTPIHVPGFGEVPMIIDNCIPSITSEIVALFEPICKDLTYLENEVSGISVEYHTGGYEDRERALEIIKKLYLKYNTI
jgi:hypothetical protein